MALHDIQELIDGLVEQVALIDCDGTIVAVNQRWRRQVERQARTGLHISRDYVSFLEALTEEGDEGARPVLQAFRDVSAGTRQTFRCIYHGTGAFDGYDFNLVIAALTVGGSRRVLVSVHDLTELVKFKSQRRRSDTQILRAQEAERRRMARELHDSTSQLLVALEMELSHLKRARMPSEVDEVITECRKTVKEMQREIRAFSFIAHPPTLTTNTLSVALESLARGFRARSGVNVDFSVSGVGRASSFVEAAIYRLAQEGLANIQRHSYARNAAVRLVGRDHYLHLMISDDGVGFDSSEGKGGTLMGVGVTGMAERVRELGGRFSIKRITKGTALRVSLPRYEHMVFEPAISAR